jgi:protein-S-isoprenylcysteine O-methyltransferase Ste14
MRRALGEVGEGRESRGAAAGSEVGRGVLAVLAATAAFSLVHTLLASRRTKAAVRGAVGARGHDAWYRPFYNAQAVVTFAALVVYGRRQPSRPVYTIGGGAGALMRAGQLAAAGYAAWAVYEVGLATFIGAPGAAAWLRGGPVPPPAEAQGPVPGADGALRAGGPFATVRHPLNTAFGAILWLQPRMTTTLLAYNVLSTLYLVAGSYHEEARLGAAYGERYERYRRSGVPFFVPEVGRDGPARLG